MSNVQQFEHKYNENSCELKLLLKKKSNAKETRLDFGPGRHVQNIRNCDLFIDDYTFLIYLDVQLFKFKSSRRFDVKDVKNFEIKYNTEEHSIVLNLPCFPVTEEEADATTEKPAKEENNKTTESSIDLWKLKKITDQCYIRINDSKELLKPEYNFSYGYASKYRGIISSAYESDIDAVTAMPEPNIVSPLQRTIDREIDEMKKFSRDIYKLNFVELQIPEGHDNPMQVVINYMDIILTRDEQLLLHNLTCKPELLEMPDEYDKVEIDCGLVSILLAICYDVRFTSNESNCESAWTRSMLSATLTYFEPFTSLKNVVISFMRSSLVYPLYRNYELSKQCVEDCIMALQSNPGWILKQLIITHDLFEANERSIFNYYYIDDYIRYLQNPAVCCCGHLQTLAHNLKNVLLDIYKRHLGLGLKEVETELLKELITDIHMAATNSEEESEDLDCEDGEEDEDDETTDDVGTESCESDICSSPDSEGDSSSTDTEDNSVIERSMDNLKL